MTIGISPNLAQNEKGKKISPAHFRKTKVDRIMDSTISLIIPSWMRVIGPYNDQDKCKAHSEWAGVSSRADFLSMPDPPRKATMAGFARRWSGKLTNGQLISFRIIKGVRVKREVGKEEKSEKMINEDDKFNIPRQRLCCCKSIQVTRKRLRNP